MTKLTQVDLDQLLNQTYYNWNTLSLLGGVVDFLEFSEGNLAWLRKREIRKAEDEGATVEFDPPDEHLAGPYRDQLVELAKYRFDVGLSQSIRYSGLVAFVTAIELCAKAFSKRLTRTIPPKPDRENEYVHVLASLNDLSSSGFAQPIDDQRKLVYLRNCIIHNAGFVEGYKHEVDVRGAAESTRGFTIWNEDFLGASICIKDNAVQVYARTAIDWVPKLDEQCAAKGILK